MIVGAAVTIIAMVGILGGSSRAEAAAPSAWSLLEIAGTADGLARVAGLTEATPRDERLLLEIIRKTREHTDSELAAATIQRIRNYFEAVRELKNARTNLGNSIS